MAFGNRPPNGGQKKYDNTNSGILFPVSPNSQKAEWGITDSGTVNVEGRDYFVDAKPIDTKKGPAMRIKLKAIEHRERPIGRALEPAPAWAEAKRFQTVERNDERQKNYQQQLEDEENENPMPEGWE